MLPSIAFAAGCAEVVVGASLMSFSLLAGLAVDLAGLLLILLSPEGHAMLAALTSAPF
jgi:hypothetical protein